MIMCSTVAFADVDGLNTQQVKKLSGQYQLVQMKGEGVHFNCDSLAISISPLGEVSVTMSGRHSDSSGLYGSVVYPIEKNGKKVSRGRVSDGHGEAAFANGDTITEKKFSSILIQSENQIEMSLMDRVAAVDPLLITRALSPKYMDNREWHTFKVNLEDQTIVYTDDFYQIHSPRRNFMTCVFKKI